MIKHHVNEIKRLFEALKRKLDGTAETKHGTAELIGKIDTELLTAMQEMNEGHSDFKPIIQLPTIDLGQVGDVVTVPDEPAPFVPDPLPEGLRLKAENERLKRDVKEAEEQRGLAVEMAYEVKQVVNDWMNR